MSMTLLALGLVMVAQPARSPDSTARAVLTRAYETLGGDRVRSAVTTLVVHGSGTEWRSAEAQGPSPHRETATPHEEWLTVDLAGDRVAHEYRTDRHDGSARWRRFVFEGDARVFADFMTRSAGRGSFAASARSRRELARRVPHLLLAETLQEDARATLVRDTLVANRPSAVVRYLPAGGSDTLMLFIERSTHLLLATASRVDFPGIGPARVVIEYDRYEPHPVLHRFPRGHHLRIGGSPFQTVRYRTVTTDSSHTSERFRLPDDLQPFASAPGTVRQVAPGVYVVEQLAGFNLMFVEFDDFLLAVEAPAAHPSLSGLPAGSAGDPSAISRQFVERMQATVPGKPIRYVVITHFHSDHAGGVRAFAEQGATIVTTPANRAWFASLLPGVAAGRIETVAGQRTITDGRQTVDLIDIGPNPHTDEMLVVHLPSHGVLFQGDLFYFYGEMMRPDPGRTGIMRHFGTWLTRQRLAPSRIYGVHGVGYATMAHVRQILGER